MYTQAGKPMRLDTSLPADTLMLERLVGEEAVSTPYEIHLDLLSTDPAIDPKKLLRKPVSVTVDLASGGKRYFHGVVRRFVQLGRSGGLVSYRAEVVPWLWFLSLASDCRIFQQLSVPDIVKKVLTDMGVTDVKLNFTGTYSPREYCVQYRESDLAFISRLMEEEGIFYFFEHEVGKHTMVLADSPSAVHPGAVGKLGMSLSAQGAVEDDCVMDLEVDSEVVSGKVTLVDYNDTVPRRIESTVAGGTQGTSAAQYRKFDYPGKFAVASDGDRLARLRQEESEALSFVVNGQTNYRGLGSGQKLDIADHYRRDVNQSYHVLSARHVANEGGYRSKTGGEPFSFLTSFKAIPHAVPYRPARTTPKSIVYGSQTALVVGPAGEEIFVDKFGRVKVQFFWDQAGQKDDKSSCWVRVSSTWAGKQWGAIQTPRIGQEVVVDFLEGDPDRPIIVGRVYNADQMPPYALPANGTQSGVVTRSTLGGNAGTANEFRFEDKKGSEQILLHAEKNSDVEVEKDETHWVGQDRKKTIDRDEVTHVKRDRTETVDNNETITINGKRAETVDKDDTITVSSGNREISVRQGNVTLKAGMGSIKYDAMQGIELKVGQNSIKVDQQGITIKGMMVTIDGQVQTEVKGLMTKVNASAMLTVKGAITMIN